MKNKSPIALVILVLVMIIPLFGQSNKEILGVEAIPYTRGWVSGESFTFAVVINVYPEWHINAHEVADEFAIPTEVILEENESFTVEKMDFPQAVMKKFNFTETEIPVYQGSVPVFITLKGKQGLLPGPLEIRGSVTYQGCNDVMCLPPGETGFSLKTYLVSPGETVELTNNPVFDKMTSTSLNEPEETPVQSPFAGKGVMLTAILLFLGGLGLNLTPCVYPLIPITISYFGGQAAGKGKSYLLAIFYVLGLSVTYSVLGTLAAFTGGMFGTALTNPIVLIFIAVILVALSLSMFGVYEFRVPTFLLQIAGGGKTGYTGALIMGLTMGIVAAPCIGPFIIGLLAYVAATGSPLVGFVYFFILSIGLGFPYLFLAGFSSKINNLPGSGEWMLGVRNIFGWILLGMALYFVSPLLPESIYHFLFPGFLIFAALFLLIFDKNGLNSRGFVIGRNLFAALVLIAAGWLIKPEAHTTGEMNWQPFSESALENALQNHQPVIIDFFADWCIPCKELDTRTFTDPAVARFSEKFLLMKVDITSDTEENRLLKEKYGIKGVPSIFFYDIKGNLREELTLYGFEKPGEFLSRMQKALE